MPDKDSKKILVADDNQDVLDIVSLALEGEGFEVLSAKDGTVALKKAKEIKPHLLLLDIMMPEKDGFEVCSALKQDSGTSDIIIIMMTAKADPDSRQRGFAAGANDYLTKPIDPQELVHRIHHYLD
jgi:two-component system alkaline phosphatase synthesis response regulator PhoP